MVPGALRAIKWRRRPEKSREAQATRPGQHLPEHRDTAAERREDQSHPDVGQETLIAVTEVRHLCDGGASQTPERDHCHRAIGVLATGASDREDRKSVV